MFLVVCIRFLKKSISIIIPCKIVLKLIVIQNIHDIVGLFMKKCNENVKLAMDFPYVGNQLANFQNGTLNFRLTYYIKIPANYLIKKR